VGIVIIRRFIYEAEDVQRYTQIRGQVQSQVEDTRDSRSESGVLEQFFGLDSCVPEIGVGSEKGEGSVWVGGIRMS
jgi:hypothetical protein